MFTQFVWGFRDDHKQSLMGESHSRSFIERKYKSSNLGGSPELGLYLVKSPECGCAQFCRHVLPLGQFRKLCILSVSIDQTYYL